MTMQETISESGFVIGRYDPDGTHPVVDGMVDDGGTVQLVGDEGVTFGKANQTPKKQTGSSGSSGSSGSGSGSARVNRNAAGNMTGRATQGMRTTTAGAIRRGGSPGVTAYDRMWQRLTHGLDEPDAGKGPTRAKYDEVKDKSKERKATIRQLEKDKAKLEGQVKGLKNAPAQPSKAPSFAEQAGKRIQAIGRSKGGRAAIAATGLTVAGIAGKKAYDASGASVRPRRDREPTYWSGGKADELAQAAASSVIAKAGTGPFVAGTTGVHGQKQIRDLDDKSVAGRLRAAQYRKNKALYGEQEARARQAHTAKVPGAGQESRIKARGAARKLVTDNAKDAASAGAASAIDDLSSAAAKKITGAVIGGTLAAGGAAAANTPWARKRKRQEADAAAAAARKKAAAQKAAEHAKKVKMTRAGIAAGAAGGAAALALGAHAKRKADERHQERVAQLVSAAKADIVEKGFASGVFNRIKARAAQAGARRAQAKQAKQQAQAQAQGLGPTAQAGTGGAKTGPMNAANSPKPPPGPDDETITQAAKRKAKWAVQNPTAAADKVATTAERVSDRAAYAVNRLADARESAYRALGGRYAAKATPQGKAKGALANLTTGQKVGLAAVGAGGVYAGSKLQGPKPHRYQQVY